MRGRSRKKKSFFLLAGPIIDRCLMAPHLFAQTFFFSIFSARLPYLQVRHLLPAALPVLYGLGEVDLGGEQVALPCGGCDRARRRGIQHQHLHALGAAVCRRCSAAAAVRGGGGGRRAQGTVDVGAHDGDEVERGGEALRTSLATGRRRGHAFFFSLSRLLSTLPCRAKEWKQASELFCRDSHHKHTTSAPRASTKSEFSSAPEEQ